MTQINTQAPVISSKEIEIEAPPEQVWEVLTGFNDWPSWNPEVKSLAMQGPVSEGTEFRWKAGPGTIRSTIQEVQAPRRIAWTGRTMGIRAIHTWDLEPREGRTFVRTAESYEGAVVRLARAPLQRILDKSLAEGLGHLKTAVEQRNAGQARTA